MNPEFPRSVDISVRVCAVAVFMTMSGISASFLGTHLEEAAGTLSQRPFWLESGMPSRSGPVSVFSNELPVWGIQRGESFFPLMINGHKGAMPYFLLRAAKTIGGLYGMRAAHILLGAVSLNLAGVLAGRLFGTAASVMTAALLAVSPVFLMIHSHARADEQWTMLCPLAAALSILKWRDGGRAGWLFAASFLLGLGVAAKTTVLWVVFAALFASAVSGLIRSPPLATAVPAALLFLIPLVPQALYIACAPSSGPFTERLHSALVSWRFFSPDRLAWFARHFAESQTGLGDAFGRLAADGAGALKPESAAAAVLLAVAVPAAAVAGLRRGTDPLRRAFGIGLLALFAQYLVFYHTGDSYFILATPWIFIAAGGAFSAGLEGIFKNRSRKPGIAVFAAVLAVPALLLANQTWQSLKFVRSSMNAVHPVFALHAQVRLASDPAVREGPEMLTTAYTSAGMLETLTDGAARPVHAYPVFKKRCLEGKSPAEAYGEAWRDVFMAAGQGAYKVLLSANPSEIEMSPCRNAGLVEGAFLEAASSCGAGTALMGEYRNGAGKVMFKMFRIEMPASRCVKGGGRWP